MKAVTHTATGQITTGVIATTEAGRQKLKVQSTLLAALLSNANLLDNNEAAAYIGVTPRTLEVWRCTKRHCIPYIKVGRLVKYRPSALDEFLTAKTVNDAMKIGG